MYQAQRHAASRPRAIASRSRSTLVGPGLERQHALRPRDRDRARRVPVGAERGDHRDRRQARRVRAAGAGAATRRARSSSACRASCTRRCWSGLKPGEQVVTIGSFFIDADHKLKGLVAGRMITAIIEHVIRFRWIVWRVVAALVGAQRLRAPHRGARRHPRHLRPADHRLREVAAQPAADRDRGDRAGHPGAGRARPTSGRSAVPRTWGTRSSTSSCRIPAAARRSGSSSPTA